MRMFSNDEHLYFEQFMDPENPHQLDAKRFIILLYHAFQIPEAGPEGLNHSKRRVPTAEFNALIWKWLDMPSPRGRLTLRHLGELSAFICQYLPEDTWRRLRWIRPIPVGDLCKDPMYVPKGVQEGIDAIVKGGEEMLGPKSGIYIEERRILSGIREWYGVDIVQRLEERGHQSLISFLPPGDDLPNARMREILAGFPSSYSKGNDKSGGQHAPASMAGLLLQLRLNTLRGYLRTMHGPEQARAANGYEMLLQLMTQGIFPVSVQWQGQRLPQHQGQEGFELKVLVGWVSEPLKGLLDKDGLFPFERL